MSQNDSDPKLAMWAEQARQRSLTDMEALTEFVVSNDELEQLEERLRQFNIFEAIGMHWQEIRHSAFLAFLLDPQQPHGLGDDFLKKILQRALLGKDAAKLPVNVIRLHLMSLEETTAQREQNSIDILLLNERHQLAVIIENKLQTGEHDNQLDRYYRFVAQQYPGWRILGLYLTPTGANPSDNRYLPLSYADVADITQTLVVSREAVLGPDVRTLMIHYVQMLRRNVVNDSEIDSLCHEIYRKHQRAIDLIVARLPDKRAQIMNYCKSLVENKPELRFRVLTKMELGFHPLSWDTSALQYYPPEQSRALIFEYYFRYEAKGLLLVIFIRPGRQEVRQKLFDLVVAHPEIFKTEGVLYSKFTRVYSRSFLSAKALQEVDVSTLQGTIAREFDKFLQTDFPRIQEALATEVWIWEKDAPYASEGAMLEDSAAIEEEEQTEDQKQ